MNRILFHSLKRRLKFDSMEMQQKPVESTTNDANHIDAKKEEVQQVMKEVKKKEEDLAKKEEKADKILKELEKQKHEQEKILNAQKQVRTRSQYFVLRTFYIRSWAANLRHFSEGQICASRLRSSNLKGSAESAVKND